MNDPLAKLRLSEADKTQPQTHSRRRIAIGLAVISVAALLLFVSLYRFNASRQAAGSSPSIAASPKPQGKASARVPSMTASSGPAAPAPADTIMAGGFIEARRSAKVYPGRYGIVSSVHVEEGQFVHKGQLLVTLDTALVAAEVSIAEAECQKAQANLDLIKAGFRREDVMDMQQQLAAATAQWEREKDLLRRSEQLVATSAVSLRNVAESRFKVAEYKAKMLALKAQTAKLESGYRTEDIAAAEAEAARARASLQYARENLALSYLKAPFDGVVTEVELEPGEALSTMSGSDGGLGIKMADITRLFVKLDIPENKISAIVPGTSAEVSVDALGKAPLKGTVTAIAPVADRQSNTIEISVEIENPPPLLRPDMSARVRINIENKDMHHAE